MRSFYKSRKILRLAIFITLPLSLALSISPAVAIEFSPTYDIAVLEHGVISIKYPSVGSTSMIIGFPKRIQAKSDCVDIVFHLAPIDPVDRESPASTFMKKFAAFTVDVWTSEGLKVGSIDSRKDPSFFAPTSITKVLLKVCDSSINAGKASILKMEFRAGVAFIGPSEIQEFSENLTIESTPIPTIKRLTITCTKGKLIKKVTAVKPKCPTGFRVKK